MGKSTVDHTCARAPAAEAEMEQLGSSLHSHGLTLDCPEDTQQVPLAHTQREKAEEAE